jgi:hypothetical protein
MPLMQRLPGHLNLPGETPVGGIETREIRHAFQVGRLIDRHHRKVSTQRRHHQRSQKATPDASISIDRNPQTHFSSRLSSFNAHKENGNMVATKLAATIANTI